MPEILILAVTLGVPVGFMSWLVFSWLYADNKLDLEAERKTIAANLKQMKKSSRSEQKDLNYMHRKWMWFGGGFYGLAALWTFFIVEVMDFLRFASNFPGFAKLFENGIANMVVNLISNQVGNIVNAFVWFNYWSDKSIVITALIAYLGYLAGVQLAKRDARKKRN